jgi:hypothetical protein
MYSVLNLNVVTYIYVSGTEPECCNLYVRIRQCTWMLEPTCTYPALNLNAVAYMYISGTEPECCNLHVRI